jgi:hypothetical protein
MKQSQDTMNCNNEDIRNNYSTGCNSNNMIWVDPAYIRFQHSRIRPVFSSCGRTLMETLTSIRDHEISPLDLPPIQVSECDCQTYRKHHLVSTTGTTITNRFTFPNAK